MQPFVKPTFQLVLRQFALLVRFNKTIQVFTFHKPLVSVIFVGLLVIVIVWDMCKMQ